MDQKQSVSLSKVISVTEIARGIFDLRLETDAFGGAVPGQFCAVYVPDDTMLLPRPLSICDATAHTLRLVFRVAGKGTERLSRLRAGDTLRVMGPLGNGYPMAGLDGKHVLLFGGGIGIPPMLYLARMLAGGDDRQQAGRDVSQKETLLPGNDVAGSDGVLSGAGTAGRDGVLSGAGAAGGDGVLSGSVRAASVTVALGYKEPDLFLADEFAAYGEVLIACEIPCGRGIQGTALDAVLLAGPDADVICACGPKPMLAAVADYAYTVPAYLSLEEHMACGIGACLACVVPTTAADAHTHVKNARVCTEGPVFPADAIVLE